MGGVGLEDKGAADKQIALTDRDGENELVNNI